MNDTVTKQPDPVGEIMKSYHLAVDKAMAAIWEKEIASQKFAHNYIPLMSPIWDEAVSAPSQAPVEDDVRAREIESRLNALGSDGSAVAKSLHRDGITGMVGSPSRCAIAQWLQKNFESYGAVSVGPQSISLLGTDGTHLSITTPPAVRAFIRMFDGGAFPTLVSERFRYLQQSLVNITITKEAPTHAAVPSPLPEFVPSL